MLPVPVRCAAIAAALLGACVPPPAAAPLAGQCPAPIAAPAAATFDRTAFAEETQFNSTIGAVSRMLSANYTLDAENVYISNTASTECRAAKIILASESIAMTTDPDAISAALEGGGRTGPWARAPECACLKDGAFQFENGMCKAQVFQTTRAIDLYQIATGANAGKPPYDKFWTPFDPRYLPSAPSGKLIRCNIPKGTVVAIGLKKNPNPAPVPPTPPPAGPGLTSPEPRPDEFLTYWFVGDTWGTWGNKDRQPRSWECVASD